MAESSSKRPAEGSLPRFPPKKKNKRSSAKRASDKERDKTRINIGPAFPRWRALRAAKGLQLDSELALLLLDAYEKGPWPSTPWTTPRLGVQPPAVSASRRFHEGEAELDEDHVNSLENCVIELSSESDGVSGDGTQERDDSSDEDYAPPPIRIRLGAALDTRPKMDDLPIIAADETIHDVPEKLGPENMPPPTEPHTVLTEEDIVGSRASIVYEESLRQLATLLHLPVKRCRYRMSTGLMCFGLPPFQCLVEQRCTAFVVEWVCPRGHVVWSWTSQPTFKFGMLAGDFMLGTNILLSGNNYSKVALLFRFMNMGVVSPATFSKIQDTYCVDTIREFWMERRSEGVQWLQGKDVVVAGGKRSDSPVLHSDVRKVIVVKEEQQEWSSSLDQEDPEPPHIKEEQEELWTSQEGEQLQGLEEADITKFTFTPVPVKSEDDEEKPQSSQLHQRLTEHMETEADGEDCGRPQLDRKSDPEPDRKPDPEPNRKSDPERQSQISSRDTTSQCNKPESKHSDEWKETREPQSGLNSLTNDDVSVSGSRSSAGEKPFGCSECGKRFGTKTYLKIHVRTHTGEKPFSCSSCGKGFTRKVLLQLHIKSHTGEKPFNCSVCDKSFTQAGSLTRHMPLHTGEKRFGCSVCERRFTWYTSLKTHKCVGHPSSQLHQTRTEEGREAEPPASSSTEQIKTEAEGEDCGVPEPDRNSDPEPEPDGNSDPHRHLEPDTDVKTGDSSETDYSDDDWKETRAPQSGLNSLNESVNDSRCGSCEKPFSCSHCGKRFGFKAHLKRHMRSHTGEKPFSCLFCKKSFAQSDSLQKHMRIHTGEKPYSCSLCGKAFSENGNLKVHMRSHTGEKPFSCSVCKKSFTKSDSLQKHMRIHTGEKPFSCTVCGKSFSESGNLKRHMRLHTGEKPSGL